MFDENNINSQGKNIVIPLLPLTGCCSIPAYDSASVCWTGKIDSSIGIGNEIRKGHFYGSPEKCQER